MYFVPTKQNKRKKNKQLLKVFIKSVVKVNTVYRNIQELVRPEVVSHKAAQQLLSKFLRNICKRMNFQ